VNLIPAASTERRIAVKPRASRDSRIVARSRQKIERAVRYLDVRTGRCHLVIPPRENEKLKREDRVSHDRRGTKEPPQKSITIRD